MFGNNSNSNSNSNCNANKSFLDDIIDLFKNGLGNCLDFKNIDLVENSSVSEKDYKAGPLVTHHRGSCHVFRQHEPERADDINIYDDGKHGKHEKHEKHERLIFP